MPYQPLAHYMRAGLLWLDALPPLSLYIHLPWCVRKCPYCDFNSHEAGSRIVNFMGHETLGLASPAPTQELAAKQLPAKLENAYIEALLADLHAVLPLIWGRPIHSIFIGGGTPSLFSPEALHQLISQVRSLLPLIPDCEITMEANPGTFEKDRFKAFRAAGVNRLSIGVQSFDDDHLKALGRVHNRAQAIAAVEEAAQCFDTFNLDLMYALPGQTVGSLKQDLAQALAFSPPHLSAYQLTIEPNTFFAKHPPVLPDDDNAYAMLDTIIDQTGAKGLGRYEVSAFAKEGHRCAHNLNYWQFGDYVGLGAGAHGKLSFPNHVVRHVKVRDPLLYMTKAGAGDALAQEDEVARADVPFEYMLGAMRLVEGVGVQEFQARTGLLPAALQAGLDKARAMGLVTTSPERVQPTARGLDFLSDLQALFLPPYKNKH
jgi:putative oxygen-independent coproporphyrinogen III oxidase